MMVYFLLLITYEALASSCAEDEFLFQNSVCKKCNEYIPSCSKCTTGSYSAITNGSFEQNTIASSFWEFFDTIPGWYPEDGEVIELKSKYTAYDGNQYLEVVTNNNVKVNQNLTTEANYWYTIEFYLSPFPTKDENSNIVNIYWDNSIIDTISQTGTGLTDNQWNGHTYSNRATASTTQLAFEGASTTTIKSGIAIDLVSYYNLPFCTECPSYHYSSIVTNTCEPCPTYNGNCSECEEVAGAPSCKVCVQGYYPSAGDCASCGSNCTDCDANGDCINCDPTYTLVSGVCVICNSPCTSCDTSGNCLSCTTGFYVQSNNCSSCPSNCNDCDANGDCTDCEPAYTIISGVCVICNSPCTSCDTSGNCLSCTTGFYVQSNNCSSCPSNCNDCDANGDCTDCEPAYTIISGVCVICNSPCTSCDTSGNCLSCTTGFYVQSNNCASCGSNCNDCDANGDCIDCDPAYTLVSGICVICNSPCTSCDTSGNCLSCTTGFYVQSNSCTNCPEQCLSCNSNGDCLECVETYEINNGGCECAEYHLVNSETSLCYYSPLEFDLEISTDSYTIQFSENLSSYLSLSSIESQFLPEGQSFDFTIIPLSLNRYELKIAASVVPEEASSVSVKLLNISGQSGSMLINNEFKLNLLSLGGEEDVDSSENSIAEAEEEEIMSGISSEEASKASVASGIASSASFSVLSGNPSALWGFVNFSLMIYYMPLQNINMPSSLRELCKGFGTDLFGIILNFANIFSLNSNSSNTGQLWRDYDIENTGFYENAGNVIFLFSIGIALLPVLGLFYLISETFKLKKVSNFLLKIILQYRWNFFLRASIEIYIEILSSAILCALTASDKRIDSEIVLSMSLCVICLLIPLLLTFLTYKYQNYLTTENSDLSKFSTYFEEFKKDRFSQLLYYPLFYTRRFCYMVGIYFLYDYPLLQVIMNSSFSFVICAYILTCKPYTNPLEGTLSAMSEFFLGSIFIATGFCLLDLSDEYATVVGKIILYGIFTLIGVNIFVSLITAFRALRSRCRRKKKKKVIKLDFAGSSTLSQQIKVSVVHEITDISNQSAINYDDQEKNNDIDSIY